MSFALSPLDSPFRLLFSSFCLLPSAFSPQSPLFVGSFGQSALQAPRRRSGWEAVASRSGILSHGFPQSLHDAAHPFHALARVLVGAMACDGCHAIPAALGLVCHAVADIIRVDAAADGDLRAADAGFLATHRGRQGGADVFDVAMADVFAEGFEVVERVVAGDERVAGVEVAAVRARKLRVKRPGLRAGFWPR